MPNILRETARGIQPIEVDDFLLNERKIFLTEFVDAESCARLLKQLMYLEAENDTEEILFYINSPGGITTDGLCILDYIHQMKAPVHTISIGTCASMGAILFLAGKKRSMYPHSRIMIHDPAYGRLDISGKKPHELQQLTDNLTLVKDSLAGIIAEKTKKTLDEVYSFTHNDSFFSAEEALKFGLATDIIGKPPKRRKGA